MTRGEWNAGREREWREDACGEKRVRAEGGEDVEGRVSELLENEGHGSER